jgi:hypothetical protein
MPEAEAKEIWARAFWADWKKQIVVVAAMIIFLLVAAWCVGILGQGTAL